ncbi:MAG: hypothetical protein WKF57_06580 [Nakamurella sp.]
MPLFWFAIVRREGSNMPDEYRRQKLTLFGPTSTHRRMSFDTAEGELPAGPVEATFMHDGWFMLGDGKYIFVDNWATIPLRTKFKLRTYWAPLLALVAVAGFWLLGRSSLEDEAKTACESSLARGVPYATDPMTYRWQEMAKAPGDSDRYQGTGSFTYFSRALGMATTTGFSCTSEDLHDGTRRTSYTLG